MEESPTPNPVPDKALYVFVGPNSDLNSTSVTIVLYPIACYI